MRSRFRLLSSALLVLGFAVIANAQTHALQASVRATSQAIQESSITLQVRRRDGQF